MNEVGNKLCTNREAAAANAKNVQNEKKCRNAECRERDRDRDKEKTGNEEIKPAVNQTPQHKRTE